MTRVTWASGAAGAAGVAALAGLLANGTGTGWVLENSGQLWLGVIIAALLVAASSAPMKAPAAALVWVLAVTWLVPELAGLAGTSAVLGVLSESWAWVLAGCAALLGAPASPASRTRTGVVALAVLGSLIGVVSRTALTQPILDPDCWLTCRTNPLAVDVDPSLHHLVDAVAAAALVAAGSVALHKARALRGDMRMAALSAATAAGLAIGLTWPPSAPAAGAAVAVRMWTYVAALLLAGHLLTHHIDAWRLRGRLQGFALELANASGPDGPAKALGAAVGDPTLEIHFWAPSRAEYVDSGGHPLPMGGIGPRAVELRRAGVPLAMVTTRRASAPAGLVAAFGPAMRLSLENAQLEANLRAELRDVDASRGRLLDATRLERRRLERNLHDGAQQRVVTLVLSLRMLGQWVAGPSRECIEHAAASAVELLHVLRQLARGIHPAVVSDSGLVGALSDLAEDHPALALHLTAHHEPSLSPSAKMLIYALTAGVCDLDERARAQEVHVTLTQGTDRVAVELAHDGDFSLERVRVQGAAAQAEALGGRLDTGGAPGGWWLELEVPCAS